jgi:enterobactin synthetase component D
MTGDRRSCGRTAPDPTRQSSALVPFDPPEILPSYAVHVAAHIASSGLAEETAAHTGLAIPSELDGAVPSRRMEFVAGRACAQRALRTLLPGFSGTVPINPDRDPRWPAGIVGSLTHSGTIAAAAVARASDALGLGIDVEAIISPDTVKSVQRLIASAGEGPAPKGYTDELYATLLFSAKEAVFKCLFPIARRPFFFEHARVDLLPATAAFRTVLLIDLAPELPAHRILWGRYAITDGHIYTAMALPARAPDLVSEA